MTWATFGGLAASKSSVIYTCMAPGFHRGAFHVTGEEGCERWGPEATIEQVRQLLRCSCCGHRGPRIVQEVFTPGDAPSGGFVRR